MVKQQPSSPPIRITLPFPKTTFPELDNLSFDERGAILERCLRAESLKTISRQSLLIRYIGLAILVIGIITGIVALQLSFTSQGINNLLCAGMAAAVGCFIASFVIYHIRSSRELKRLVQQELRLRGQKKTKET